VLTRQAIAKRADDDGVSAMVAERDYVLAHVVSQLHRSSLGEGKRLVFKGGTAMRFVHVEDFRYSADLDFTIVGGSSEDGVLSLAPVVEAARQQAGLPHLEIVEGTPRSLAYIGPLAAGKLRTVKLDIADNEYVESIDNRTMRKVWDDLPEPVPFDVYPLDEIAAEKLRCIIQRVQCRDLYDLYRLGEDLGVAFEEVVPLFERKAESTGIDPGSFSGRFEDRCEKCQKKWTEEMSVHLGDPPRFDDVERIVRRHLRRAGLLD
jgi:predicted nucleotidyltransferase component of viral defense system